MVENNTTNLVTLKETAKSITIILKSIEYNNNNQEIIADTEIKKVILVIKTSNKI